MSRADVFLWVVIPYAAIAIFIVGHILRYRRDQRSWGSHSTQLLEQRTLRWGSWLFHFGALAVIGGHVLGLLIPESWTAAVGIDDHAYHVIALAAGLPAGLAMTAGLALLLYRRSAFAPIRVTTLGSDLFMYPLLVVVTLTGMAATISNAFDEHRYRETVSPWFRGIFTFDPNVALITEAPVVFQLHAVTSFILLAAWPFTRLVHVWSVPVAYLTRSWIPYRSRTPRASLADARARRRERLAAVDGDGS